MGPTLARMARARRSGAPARDRRLALDESRAAERAARRTAWRRSRADLLDRATSPRCPTRRTSSSWRGRSSARPATPAAHLGDEHARSRIRAPSATRARASSRSPPATCTRYVPARGGSRESDPPAPVGEYAYSCLARERDASSTRPSRSGTPVAHRAPQLRARPPLRRADRHRDCASRAASRSTSRWGTSTSSGRATRTRWRSQRLAHARSRPFVVNVDRRRRRSASPSSRARSASGSAASRCSSGTEGARRAAQRRVAHARAARSRRSSRSTRCSTGSRAGCARAARCSASRRTSSAAMAASDRDARVCARRSARAW